LLVGVGYDGDWNIEFGASASSAVCSFFFLYGLFEMLGRLCAIWVLFDRGLDVIGAIRFEIWCLLLEMQSNR